MLDDAYWSPMLFLLFSSYVSVSVCLLKKSKYWSGGGYRGAWGAASQPDSVSVAGWLTFPHIQIAHVRNYMRNWLSGSWKYSSFGVFPQTPPPDRRHPPHRQSLDPPLLLIKNWCNLVGTCSLWWTLEVIRFCWSWPWPLTLKAIFVVFRIRKLPVIWKLLVRFLCRYTGWAKKVDHF